MIDVIIIGAGPSGLACAIAAKKANLDVLVLDKGVLANSIYQFPVNMTFFSTSKLLEVGNVPFISHSDKPNRREALEYYRRLADAYKLPVQTYEAVTHMEPLQTETGYTLTTTRNRYKTRFVVVATGFYDTPVWLNIPGENLPKVKHYFDDAHPYVGQNLLVVGARNSACDVALETWSKGANVTMVIRGESIHPKVKYWIKPNIENRIKEGSIRAFFNSSLTEIREHEVTIQTPQGLVTIPNDFVLAMTGYQPNYDFLSNLGIEWEEGVQRKPLYNPETLETNVPGVYLAGVVCAGMYTNQLFIENTRDHGDLIVAHLLEKKQATNALPSTANYV